MHSKRKDFFYDKNDIIIALVILLVAAVVILTRVNAIMDYPTTLAEAAAEKQSQTEETSQSFTIKSGEDLVDIGNNLVSLGYFDSQEAFAAKVKELGVEKQLKADTFDIPYAATEDDVIKILTE